MAAPVYPTKGELRDELLIRLGYGGLGSAAANFVPMADVLLEEAQAMLYEIFTDDKGVREWDGNIGTAQRWVDIPAELDIDKMQGIWVKWGGSTEDDWYPLRRGIEYHHDSDYDDHEDHPQRYDIRYNPTAGKAQIEIWPKTDQVYPYKIEGHMEVSDFVADSDRASFPKYMVLLYAEAYGKAHLNKRDAKVVMDRWETFLKKRRAKQHNGNTYIRKTQRELRRDHVPPRPKVI